MDRDTNMLMTVGELRQVVKDTVVEAKESHDLLLKKITGVLKTIGYTVQKRRNCYNEVQVSFETNDVSLMRSPIKNVERVITELSSIGLETTSSEFNDSVTLKGDKFSVVIPIKFTARGPLGADVIVTVTKIMLQERVHTGRFTVDTKFNPHVYNVDDVYHAAMDEFYGVGSDLGTQDSSDPIFVGYVMDKFAGNVPRDIMDAVRTKLEKNVKKTRK